VASKGIYPAVSGAIAQAQRLDTISNNIANANTIGFKRDEQTFREYLTYLEKQDDHIKVPKQLASIESFYDQLGKDQSYVDSNGSYIDFSQGVMLPTGRSLDVAIEGEGFFEFATPEGIRYSRRGSFNIDGNGTLVNHLGHPVLTADEGNPEERLIRVNPSAGPVRVDDQGGVYQGGEFLGQLAVVKAQNPQQLRKSGHGYFELKNSGDAASSLSYLENPQLKSGFLEGSNVNIVKEMTDLISATRAFETNQKAIQAYDSLADKLVNQVPKL
jgi:flagellar basal-body rod protein FlgG